MARRVKALAVQARGPEVVCSVPPFQKQLQPQNYEGWSQEDCSGLLAASSAPSSDRLKPLGQMCQGRRPNIFLEGAECACTPHCTYTGDGKISTGDTCAGASVSTAPELNIEGTLRRLFLHTRNVRAEHTLLNSQLHHAGES